jgi:hypothetical protein
MNSIVVIVERDIAADELLRAYAILGQAFPPERPDDPVAVQGDWGAFWIKRQDAAPLYEPAELEFISGRFRAPRFYVIDYTTKDAANGAVMHFPTATDALVDNDHGAIAPIEKVRTQIRHGLEWQTVATSESNQGTS